jgi:hypothetical protein
MTGPRDPSEPIDPLHPRDPEGPPAEETTAWPARDLDEPLPGDALAEGREGPPPDVIEMPVERWDPRRYSDRRKPTTAEQAVPWLVGFVLALSGIVIVLLALIYTDANGGFASSSGRSSPSAAPSVQTPTATPSASPSATATASASSTPAPTPPPTYGTLEMLYLSRPSALAASQLYRDNFANSTAATVLARANLDIAHYAVSPDGTMIVAIVNGNLLTVTPGKQRTLATNVDAATFGGDGRTVYIVRVTRGGTTDDATLSGISFTTGTTTALATINFHHPAADQLGALAAARFFDEGGAYRIYPTSDGKLVFWVSNAGKWQIDPGTRETAPAPRQPVLWSPDGSRRITIGENGLVTTLAVVDGAGKTSARVSVTGLISHLRWSPKGDRVVFTLGRNAAGGGVRQDLYWWDLVNGRQPRQLTANGASFGAEWLGVAEFWEP